MARAYAQGDSLLLQYANAVDGSVRGYFQAKASLHWVINDALTGFGGKPLIDVMQGFSANRPEYLYTPTVNVTFRNMTRKEIRQLIPPPTSRNGQKFIPGYLSFLFIDSLAGGGTQI